MGLQSRHAFPTSRRPDPRQAWDALPPEIAFLADRVDRDILVEAAQAARRAAVCPARSLIALGHVSASAYYAALAQHLRLPFTADWPELAAGTDPARALATGRVELAGQGPHRWLVAPQDGQLRDLLSRRLNFFDASQVAIATPAHLAAVVHYRSQLAVEAIATHKLPRMASRFSAKGAFDARTWSTIGLLAVALALVACTAPHLVGDLFGPLFLGGMIFRLFAAGAALKPPGPPAPMLADAALPSYTVLVPLHREGEVVPDILAALTAIDYPRAKLEVLLLIEPDDHETRAALASSSLPPWLQVVFAPRLGGVRTKPRALNVGLLMASGDLLTVYDAEDRPDPDQLRRAAAAFGADRAVACLQARLVMDNGDTSILARMFAIEYAALFDVLNVGIARFGLPLALGGTSNHFRRSALRAVGGWDAWNVTEDADLGLRLARLGYRVGCLDSKTREAAPKGLAVWMKQRRRWMKGWMQTLIVLLRDAPVVSRRLGWAGSLATASLLGNMVIGPLGLPFFCGLVAYDLATYGVPAPDDLVHLLEATLAASVLLIGIVSTVWCGWIGMRIRGITRFLPSLPLFLPYQLMISVAAWFALRDLVFQPYHWHKTPHARHEAHLGASTTPRYGSALKVAIRAFRSDRRAAISGSDIFS